jgi:hypothetical protein
MDVRCLLLEAEVYDIIPLPAQWRPFMKTDLNFKCAAALLIRSMQEGWTPLHAAAGGGRLGHVQLLVSMRADAAATDRVRNPYAFYTQLGLRKTIIAPSQSS